MSNGTVTIVWEARIDQVLKETQRLQAQTAKLIETNRELSRRSAQGSSEAVRGLMNVGRSVLQATGLYMGLAGAIGMVKNAFVEWESIQRRSRDWTMSVATAQRKMYANLEQIERKGEVDKMVRDVALNYSPEGGMATTYQLFSSGLSASESNIEATKQAVIAAFRVAPQDQESALQTTLGVLGLRNVTGTDDVNQNLGLLLQFATASRGHELEAVAKYGVQSVVGVSQYGGTAQQAAAIVAAMSHGANDPEMRISGTASVSLAKQLAESFPAEDVDEWDVDPTTGKRKHIRKKGTGLWSTKERIDYLNENPAEAARFARGLTMERKPYAAALQLIGLTAKAKPGEEPLDHEDRRRANMTRKYYLGALDTMNHPLDELGRYAEEKIAAIDDTIIQNIAKGKRQQVVFKEMGDMTKQGVRRATMDAYSSTEIEELLEKYDAGVMEKWGAGLTMRFGGPIASMFGMSRPELFQSLVSGRVQSMFDSGDVEEGKELFEALQRINTNAAKTNQLLDDISRQQSMQTQAVQEQTDIMKQPARRQSPSPAQIKASLRN